MGLDTGITLLENVFTQSSFFGSSWIVGLAIVVFSLAILTRKVSDWKTLAFPLVVGWGEFGLNLPFILYMITGVIFVFDNLSVKMVENVWGTIKGSASRLNVKSEMAKIREATALSRAKEFGEMAGKRAKVREYEKGATGQEFDELRVLGMSQTGNATTMSNLSKLGRGQTGTQMTEAQIRKARAERIAQQERHNAVLNRLALKRRFNKLKGIEEGEYPDDD